MDGIHEKPPRIAAAVHRDRVLTATAQRLCSVAGVLTLLLTFGLSASVLAPPVAVAAATTPVALAAAAQPHAGATSTVRARRDRRAVTVRGMLALVNVLRAVPQTCGNKEMPAVGPLRRNKRLNRAAADYATKMARNDWFEHDAPDGTDPGERISDAGYRWSKWGENIAAGYDDVPGVLAAWLASPGHCRTLMGSYRHVGFGVAYDKSSTFGHYWVQDFASPR